MGKRNVKRHKNIFIFYEFQRVSCRHSLLKQKAVDFFVPTFILGGPKACMWNFKILISEKVVWLQTKHILGFTSLLIDLPKKCPKCSCQGLSFGITQPSLISVFQNVSYKLWGLLGEKFTHTVYRYINQKKYNFIRNTMI